jgi:large subunit ribosomal protein L24
MQKIKKNDVVIVTAGKDKGKKGRILKILKKRNRVLVEGVNLVTKSKPQANNSSENGLTKIESTLHMSNISLYSEKENGPSKVKIESKMNKNFRKLKACNSEL